MVEKSLDLGEVMKYQLNPNRFKNAMWLHNLAKWSVALTVTFTKQKNTGNYRLHTDVVNTTRYLIRLINKDCFGHGALRKGYCIASAFVIECGYDGRHPHIHATLSIPPHLDYESLCRIILKRANKLHSIGRQIDIQPYKNFGWFEYSLKTGFENLVVEDIQKAHHRG